jgi:uncharacterized membrane protein YhhN
VTHILLVLAFLAAVVNEIAQYKNQQTLVYVAKPAVMVFLFAWLAVTAGLSGPLLYFGLGIVFSLGGDIFLMLPDDKKWFLPGLVSFLLAHVFYILGLNYIIPSLNVFGIVLAISIALFVAQIYRRIAAGLHASGQDKLRLPVLIYSIVISLMWLSALQTIFQPSWGTTASLLVSVGATLFVASDIILAWYRFVNPIKNGRIINLITYHLGQILLIIGAALQFALVS